MDVLKIFLLGFLFVYAIQFLDLLLQLVSSYISILITKCNAKIVEISGENKVDDNYRIGFQYEPPEDYYYDEDDEEYYDKKSKK